MTHHRHVVALALTGILCLACGDDGGGDEAGGGTGSPDAVGQVCEIPDDCYPDVEHEELAGSVECLERVRGGYCTHQCGGDDDCCAVEGECKTDLPQVCSPFESTGLMMCFLSCEAEDVEAADAEDEAAFCQHEASPDFICRSSGGGANNRKVCVPGDCGVGAACGDDADCDPDLECIGYVDGGYCGVRECTNNADCPADSLCVAHDEGNFCARTCSAPTDCTFCRPEGVHASCTSDAPFVEDGTSGTVCLVTG